MAGPALKSVKNLKPVRREFGFVNLVVEASPDEVKLWACSKEGVSVFRLKARGGTIVYNQEQRDFHDVIIHGGTK